ncbi:40549_t:CDS:1, partial [Gigaspora margarita]
MEYGNLKIGKQQANLSHLEPNYPTLDVAPLNKPISLKNANFQQNNERIIMAV